MGTVAEKLQAIVNSKAAIKQALIDKGQDPSDVLSTYAGVIDDIVLGIPNLCGTLTFTGTYASAPYFTESGSRMGCNDRGDVFLIVQGGTSASYENVVFVLTSAPAEISLEQTPVYTHASNSAGVHYGCVLTGVTQKINIAVNLDTINSSYDYVRANLTVTYA
jgi:hypothetical protein